jgi:hypothetical protein
MAMRYIKAHREHSQAKYKKDDEISSRIAGVTDQTWTTPE